MSMADVVADEVAGKDLWMRIQNQKRAKAFRDSKWSGGKNVG